MDVLKDSMYNNEMTKSMTHMAELASKRKSVLEKLANSPAKRILEDSPAERFKKSLTVGDHIAHS